MKTSITVIGAGSIGALKPKEIDNKTTKYPLTHAHALWNIRDKVYVNFVEYNPCKRHDVMWRWSFPCYESLEHVPHSDVYVIAVPTDYHKRVLQKVIDLKPKLIICEKPFCNNYNDAKKIIKLAKKNNIKIIVNYSRRYLDVFNSIHSEFENQEIHYAMLKYNRGLKREASHGINLFNHWFGELKSCQLLDNFIYDYSYRDKTQSVFMKYDKCPAVYLCPVNGSDYSIFEIEISITNGRYIFVQNGRKLKKHIEKKQSMYGNYEEIDFGKVEIIETGLENSLTRLYENVLGYFNNSSVNLCDASEALKVHAVYKKLGV